MAQLFADLWAWVVAVIAQAAFVVGSILAFAAWIAEALGMKNRVGNLASRGILVGTLILASFLAWRSERDKAIVYDEPKGKLAIAYLNPDVPANGFDLIAVVWIANPGEPTSFHHFSATFLSGGKLVEGALGAMPTKVTALTCGYTVTYSTGDSLLERALKSVPTGSSIEGVLLAAFPNRDIHSVDLSSLKIGFWDIHDNPYVVDNLQSLSPRIFVLPDVRKIRIPAAAGVGIVEKWTPYSSPDCKNIAP